MDGFAAVVYLKWGQKCLCEHFNISTVYVLNVIWSEIGHPLPLLKMCSFPLLFSFSLIFPFFFQSLSIPKNEEHEVDINRFICLSRAPHKLYTSTTLTKQCENPRRAGKSPLSSLCHLHVLLHCDVNCYYCHHLIQPLY